MGHDPIRSLRRRAGLTQAALARAAGTSQPTISAYEAGDRSPTLRTLDQLAAAAGLETAVDFMPPMTREDRRSLALHHAIADRVARDPGSLALHASVERGLPPEALRSIEVDVAALRGDPDGSLADLIDGSIGDGQPPSWAGSRSLRTIDT